ncbi:MAG: 16S rRNA (cytidine(1402)-2'-O)-methyltransferase [Dehalococcoidales bacterium]|nr:16S rRNA (cytidine(1402)-2'-O)-methyltransferase [Dehalococcoidales bacterium]
MPALYVVATPIGNLEDITLRAIRILKQVKLIAAEDTRETRKLLAAYNIQTPVTSYHEHNKLTKLEYILNQLQSGDVALVSDAGTPGISDPGYELIVAVSQRNIPVIPVPGPSVLITSLIVSGLPTDSFTYLGFLPHKTSGRRRILETICQEPRTLVFFESPHRLQDTLRDMLDILGDRKIAVCRELTKLHEEIFRGTISEAIQHFILPRGEFTIVVAGIQQAKKENEITSEIESRLATLRQSGINAREAISRLAEETGISRRKLYQAWIKLSKE